MVTECFASRNQHRNTTNRVLYCFLIAVQQLLKYPFSRYHFREKNFHFMILFYMKMFAVMEKYRKYVVYSKWYDDYKNRSEIMSTYILILKATVHAFKYWIWGPHKPPQILAVAVLFMLVILKYIQICEKLTLAVWHGDQCRAVFAIWKGF